MCAVFLLKISGIKDLICVERRRFFLARGRLSWSRAMARGEDYIEYKRPPYGGLLNYSFLNEYMQM